MSPRSWIDLFACAAQLALALASFARVSQGLVARALGRLCLCIAAWSACALVHNLTGKVAWTLLDHTISPLSAPLALDFALTFDGRRRPLRALLATAYALCGALGAVSIVAFFEPALQPLPTSPAWNVAMLCLGIPTIALALVLFMGRLQRSVEKLEVERTRLAFAAFAIAVLLGSTDAVTPLAPEVPALGRVGLLVGTSTLAVVALRSPWTESARALRRFTYALATSGVALLLYLAIFGFANAMMSWLVLGTLAVSIALVTASRRWATEAAIQKERVAQLTSLGRFSAQMAHDVRNPLAALKGAAQLLREDIATPSAPRAGPTPEALVALMLAEIDRMERVVDTYGKLARVEVVPERLDVNEVVRAVIRTHSLASPDGVSFRAYLADNLPTCRGDRDLLASAFENVVRNAVESLPRAAPGSVVVRTARPEPGEPRGVVVVVEDSGAGMDDETRERAFEDFFTTKPTGSGLGLAFVRRVVHAHHGEVTLTSSPGRGTVVSIRLPAA